MTHGCICPLCVATFYTHTDLGRGETAQWHREDHQEYWNALIGCFQPIQVIWGNTRTRADRSGNSSSHAPQCGVQPASQVWPDSLICDSLSLEISPSLKFEHFFSQKSRSKAFFASPSLQNIAWRIWVWKKRPLHLRQRNDRRPAMSAPLAFGEPETKKRRFALIASPRNAPWLPIGFLFPHLKTMTIDVFSSFRSWLIPQIEQIHFKRLGGNWCLLSTHSSLIRPLLVLH